jgi:3-oxoadipate enol-lactonase
VIEVIADVLRNTHARGYADTCEAIAAFDSRTRLGALECRALVLAGEYDTGTPIAENRSIAEVITGARFTALEAAHLAPIEQSSRFAALLESFLEEAV